MTSFWVPRGRVTSRVYARRRRRLDVLAWTGPHLGDGDGARLNASTPRPRPRCARRGGAGGFARGKSRRSRQHVATHAGASFRAVCGPGLNGVRAEAERWGWTSSSIAGWVDADVAGQGAQPEGPGRDVWLQPPSFLDLGGSRRTGGGPISVPRVPLQVITAREGVITAREGDESSRCCDESSRCCDDSFTSCNDSFR
jgi:hypothetical protein